MIRAFIAVELTPGLRGHIEDLQQQVKRELVQELRRRAPGARIQWVRAESIHATLKFLGDVTEDGVRDIERALAGVATRHAAFAVEVGGLGVFPGPRAPRVIWVGLGGAVDRLTRLAADVEAALAELGYPPERRPFQPHLTLARIKDHGREVGEALGRTGLLAQPTTVGQLDVSALALMKSELNPAGAVYTRLAEAPLAKP